MQMTRSFRAPKLRLSKLRGRGKGSMRMRPLPTHGSEDEEDDDFDVESSRKASQPAMESQVAELQNKVAELENALAAMRVHYENSLQGEKAARTEHSATMSRLLDEVCDVLQRELNPEKQTRRDALAAVRAEFAALGRASSIVSPGTR